MQLTTKELINEGSYGRVYKSIDEATGKLYAVKERKYNKREDDFGIPKDILREIVLLKKLNHENIVRPVQVEIDNKAKLYRVVLEYFEYDLLGFLNIYRMNNRRIPLADIKSITKQLLKGLEYLHSNLIVHRDLKPSNILIRKDLHIKIADFGFAKQIAMPLRILSKHVGTLTYRAPELLVEEDNDYGPSVDIWAVGCILINLIIRDKFIEGVDDRTLLIRLIGIIGIDRFISCAIYQRFLDEVMGLGITNIGFKLENLKSKLGDEGFDFISKLMEPDPISRVEAVEALLHPWLAD